MKVKMTEEVLASCWIQAQAPCKKPHEVASLRTQKKFLHVHYFRAVYTYVLFLGGYTFPYIHRIGTQLEYFFKTTYLILVNLQAVAGGKKCYFRR